jgi:uncharacterized protein
MWVRHCIEKHNPLLTLHGHIHESPYISGKWKDEINHSICINPGNGKGLHAVTITIENNQIQELKHSLFK